MTNKKSKGRVEKKLFPMAAFYYYSCSALLASDDNFLSKQQHQVHSVMRIQRRKK